MIPCLAYLSLKNTEAGGMLGRPWITPKSSVNHVDIVVFCSSAQFIMPVL
jgi:hypothetical protein